MDRTSRTAPLQPRSLGDAEPLKRPTGPIDTLRSTGDATQIVPEQETGELFESHDLIGSDRVEGTDVYRSDGTKCGRIERVMLEKRSGRATYAVMSFGGSFGTHAHYPIPWSKLTYNTRLGGYELNVTDAELKGAPTVPAGSEGDWDARRGKDIHDHYKVPVYWLGWP